MAMIRGLLSLWVLLILVAVEPQIAHGSSRGSFGLTSNGAVAAPSGGICASSVNIHGYKCQEIEVTTEDGYILSMQRIPEGRAGGGNGSNKRQPVLLQHGLFLDGITWLLNSPEQNLPMFLADQGFDVWIANTRGTRYSRRHTSLDPKQKEFWNWSFDELIDYDLQGVFDYVYSHTEQKIDYVGHSLGTLMALASLSEGKLKDMINSAALLSPIAYLSHMTSPVGVIITRAFLGEIATFFGFAEFDPKGIPVNNLLKFLCATNPGIHCYDLLTSITGKNCCLNASTIQLFLQSEPQSTASKNLVHLSQIVRDEVIAKYNYGRPDYNLMHYGEAMPPVYNMSNIPHDFPLFISYGGQDALSDVRDVEHLLDIFKLHDVDKLSVQYIKNYAHADFIMGINAKDIVYNQIVSFFKRQR